ncbi:hypothetical protein, partial [Streptomyces rimosus]|uniref:hypothetical protein n=1 Tax=Streptomyces rimosus TaxID=1927 RepID=UPI0004BF78E8
AENLLCTAMVELFLRDLSHKTAASLRCETYDEAVRDLAERIDATDGELREGITSLAAQLTESRLAEPGGVSP